MANLGQRTLEDRRRCGMAGVSRCLDKAYEGKGFSSWLMFPVDALEGVPAEDG
jgi:hypothetical protein